MTDLSKELGEIKAKYGFYPNIVEALIAQSEAEDHRGAGGLCRDAADRMRRLLHIIEVEIPGMLRARAVELKAESDTLNLSNKSGEIGNWTRSAVAILELRSQATLIESLTNEKEKG